MAKNDLSGKTAIVTGASRGLGRHIARALAREGMTLVLAARNAEELEALAGELRAAGAQASAQPCDVAKLEDLDRLVAAAGTVDVLVNNAGIEQVAPFDQIPLDTMRRMLEVNLVAAMTLTRLVLPGMLKRGFGHIVNIASLAGKAGPPLSETYAASKAGLIGFTQSLRASYDGTGIHASAVCPGFVDSEGMFADRVKSAGVNAPKLMGTSPPERVAQAVVTALRTDRPEILVTPGPARLMAAMSQLFPRLPGWMIRRMGLREMYRKSSEAQ